MNRTRTVVGLWLLLFVLYPSASFGSWFWSNPLPQGNAFNGIAYGDGVYVAVADYGAIYSSSYGFINPGIVENLTGIAFGNGTFVAVGAYGALLTSSDSGEWRLHDPIQQGAFNSYSSVAYGNGAFVAVASGYTFTSLDNGVTWRRQQVLDPEEYSFHRIIFVNNLFVAVADAAKIFTSPDGLTWSDRSIPLSVANSDSNLMAVAYGQGIFVTVSMWGEVFSSPDLRAWTREACTLTASDLTFAGGTFVAVGGDNSSGIIYSSSDGQQWSELENQDWFPFRSCTFISGEFIATGSYGQLMGSTDARNWTDLSSRVTTVPLNTVAYGNSLFIAASYSPNNVLLSSPDGVTWTQLPALPGSPSISRVRFVNGAFYLMCSDSLLASQDGVTWTTALSTLISATQT